MKKGLTFFLAILVVVFISGCESSNSNYIETDKKLTDMTIYKYTSNQTDCPDWEYQTLFETDDYKYVYDNQCPTSYFIQETDDYIELVKYINSHDLSNSEIENSEIGRKITK